jgi:RNA polymerase sigma-70 factor (ECF subfamily)
MTALNPFPISNMILPTSDHSSSATDSAGDFDSISSSEHRRPWHPPSIDRAELTELVTRAQAGESPAQSELVRRYTRRIAGYARLIICQPDAVDDVTQMVFIKMFRRLSRLRDPASFESWLFRLARNTAVDFIRRRRCRPLTVPVEHETYEIPDPSSARASHEILDALEAALAQVSPTDRELLTLFVQGNSYLNLARRNGLTMGAVKARLHRMRPFLRSYVGDATETRRPATRLGQTRRTEDRGQMADRTSRGSLAA